MNSPWRPRRRRRPYPYYKVQVHSEVEAWQDVRGAFSTIEEAKQYILGLVPPKPARIVVVEENRRYVLPTEE